MRDEAVIALLLVLVIASAGAGYYVGNSNRQTVTTTTVLSSISTLPITYTTTQTKYIPAGTACTEPVPPPPAGTNDSNLFYLSASSKSTVCVTYEFRGTGSFAPTNPLLGLMQNDTGHSCPSSSCWGINVTASPIFAQYYGRTNITLTYQISTTALLESGVYAIGISQCVPVLLVYGQNYTRISTDYTGGETSGYCNFGQPVEYWVIGVSNLTISAVPTYAQRH